VNIQDVKRFALGQLIAEQRALYNDNRNPMHAFKAYRCARAAKVDVPEWVLEMLDEWAELLLVQRPGARGKDIARALGLAGPGRGTVMARAKTKTRYLYLAQRIAELQKNYLAVSTPDGEGYIPAAALPAWTEEQERRGKERRRDSSGKKRGKPPETMTLDAAIKATADEEGLDAGVVAAAWDCVTRVPKRRRRP
jgi:hypothetical protein